VLLFLVLSQRDPELGMKAARWMIVIVLFHSGLQKMVMGQYFNGAFLAFNTATIQNFSDFMGLVLSGDEFARIREMAGKPGTGPYAVSDPLFVVMSNLVWIGEMSLGLLTTRSDFMSVRLMLGLFADPLPVARAMAGTHPAYQKWEITVNEVGLSRRCRHMHGPAIFDTSKFHASQNSLGLSGDSLNS
jgi:hypothetical protein